MILTGFLGGLIVAWALSWFDIDDIILDGVEELFHKKFSHNVYYLVAGIIGAISTFFGWKGI